jgi:hypothetical protein
VNADLDRACEHLDFEAEVAVNRLGTGDTADGMPSAYVAGVRVKCADCGEPFRWVGVPAGLSFGHPTVSVDEAELHAPIRPASADPDFGLGIPGFAINFRPGGDA